jgi:hypothetical protein
MRCAKAFHVFRYWHEADMLNAPLRSVHAIGTFIDQVSPRLFAFGVAAVTLTLAFSSPTSTSQGAVGLLKRANEKVEISREAAS